MISRTLVQMIEDHADKITARILRKQRLDPELPHTSKLPESELEGLAEDVLKNLGRCLDAGGVGENARRWERFGRLRFEEGIPLSEVVRSLHIVRETLVDYVREQGVGQSAVELYAEEELEHMLGLYFDNAVYHAVRGYEGLLRRAASVAC